LADAATMNASDDSDEDIFDAIARPTVRCENISSLLQCTEDETCCEMLQFSSNGETCSVGPLMESVMPAAHHQTTVQPTSSDSDCKCDIVNNNPQGTAVPATSGLNCDPSVGIDSSVANIHCDDTNRTTDSIVRTDCTDSYLTDIDTPEVIGSSHPAESTDSHVSVNSSEQDDELLAELENEFSCATSLQNNSLLPDYCSVKAPLSSPVDQLSNSDSMSTLASLQRRQQALECRLQNTLEAKRELEAENARLECKLSASQEALEAAKNDIESAKSQVWCLCGLSVSLNLLCSSMLKYIISKFVIVNSVTVVKRCKMYLI